MKRSLAAVIMLMAVFVPASAQAETIKMGGSGGMISLVTELAQAYTAKHPGDTIDIMKQSIEAKGGIMGAAEGRLDIGMSARLLEGDERALGLKATEIARVGTAVAVNAQSVKVHSLRSSQVCEIYSGLIKNWAEVGGQNAPIKVFTRPEPDATKISVRRGLKCFADLKEASHAISMPKSQDMFNALLNNSDSIGFTDIVAVDDAGGNIRALAIDGVECTPENVRNGKWPAVKNFILVTKGEPKGLSAKFIDFVRSPEGARIITKNKAVPVK